MSADVAFYGLLLMAAALVLLAAADARDRKRERAADVARMSEPPTPYVSEQPLFLDEWSDTLTHDALALERLRDGLEGWGK